MLSSSFLCFAVMNDEHLCSDLEGVKCRKLCVGVKDPILCVYPAVGGPILENFCRMVAFLSIKSSSSSS